jgi:hypothetical protein
VDAFLDDVSEWYLVCRGGSRRHVLTLPIVNDVGNLAGHDVHHQLAELDGIAGAGGAFGCHEPSAPFGFDLLNDGIPDALEHRVSAAVAFHAGGALKQRITGRFLNALGLIRKCLWQVDHFMLSIQRAVWHQ